MNVTDATNYSAGFNEGNNHQTTFVNDFEYDTYGNLIIDKNKGITEISYNHLNLPKKITFGTQGTITYLYDATGQKLKKTMTEGTNLQNTHYLDGFQYTQEALDFFPHKEGYVKVVSAQGVGGGSSFNYVFTYTDHLGNIRLRYTKTETQGLTILEENHYYPFGLKHNGFNSDHKIFEFNDGTNTVVLTPVTPSRKETYKYKFNGKEFQDEFNINLYDYGARNYDPALGRWMNIDFLAEQYYSESPYSYTLNNPVVYIDPDGMSVDVTQLFKSEEGVETAINTLLDLSEQTGLSLSIKNSDDRFTLEYAKDDNGNAIVMENDGVQMGSSDARNQLTNMIDDTDRALVSLRPNNRGSGVPGGSNIIYLDPIQINSHINNVSAGLNSKTIGYGMTFLHETYHTRIGGGLPDTNIDYGKGPTVEKMNTIRQQLDNNPLNRTMGNGTQYGERKYYMGTDRTSTPGNGGIIIRATMHFTIRNERGNNTNATTKTQVTQ